jgi:phosphoenolpyruvate synthase/pyruvate phosphate dikinase
MAALMVGIALPVIAAAAPATLEVLEKQLRELQTQIEQLKQDKQQQDRRMREIEAVEKERAAKEAEALREQAKRGAEQERKTGILAEELEAIKSRYLLPETVEYKSLYGLGPAASKVYHLPRGLSIGGYGEANAIFFTHDNEGPNKKRDVGDFLRFVTYIGYKFSDRIILNSEIEFEHGTTSSTKASSGGSVSVEFANLDFLLTDWANIRAGLLLMPMGFLNEIHEPPFYFGNQRPEVERRIIPTTFRELGVGLHGTILPGLTYRTYVTNSLNAKGFTSADIRGARQQGNRALYEDFAWTTRLDYTPMPGLLVGGSVFWGDTGQDQLFNGKEIAANLRLYEFHGQYEYRGLRLRTLFAQGHISDARALSADLKQSISRRMLGGYVEAAYDILPLIFPGTEMSLSPFFRYERLDTQADVPSGFTPDKSKDNRVINVGFSFKPIPNVVLKLDYRDLSAEKGKVADEITVGLGFIF